MTCAVLIQLDASSKEATTFRDAIGARGIDGVTFRFASAEDEQLAVAGEVDVLVGERTSEAFVRAAERLRWVSFWGAGLDRRIPPALASRGDVVISNASGAHGPNVAEHVLGMILVFTRRLHQYLRAQIAREWRHDADGYDARYWPGELRGKTLGILGLGRIGEAIAVRARPFGVRIVAVKRDPSTRHDPSVEVDALWGLPEVERLLAESDHVCLALPYTKETHHLIDDARIARMKRGACIYNVGRGRSLDEAALVRALEAGALSGAGLDVFEEEPLSPASPLWARDDVLITPHVAGLTPHYFERAADLFAENLARFVRGEPLRNVFDAARGY